MRVVDSANGINAVLSVGDASGHSNAFSACQSREAGLRLVFTRLDFGLITNSFAIEYICPTR